MKGPSPTTTSRPNLSSSSGASTTSTPPLSEPAAGGVQTSNVNQTLPSWSASSTLRAERDGSVRVTGGANASPSSRAARSSQPASVVSVQATTSCPFPSTTAAGRITSRVPFGSPGPATSNGAGARLLGGRSRFPSGWSKRTRIVSPTPGSHETLIR